MRALLRVLICPACLVASGLAPAQESRDCPALFHEAAIVEHEPIAVDRLEGQTVFPVPDLPGLLGSLAGFCIAVFDAGSVMPIVAGSTDDTGSFEFASLPAGYYVLIGKHASGQGESLRLPVRLLNEADAGEAKRGLLIRVDMQGSRQDARGEAIGNLDLRRTLVGMLAADQAIRTEMIDQGMENVAPEMQERMNNVDAQTELHLAEILREHGWPGLDVVGLDGSNAASVMLQHAGRELQRQAMPLVEAGFRARTVSGPNYAMLVDRVRLSEGRPQLYGTVAMPFTQTGEVTFQPIEDESGVDARRAEVGLMPLEEYRQLMRQMYFPDPTKSGAMRANEPGY
ncbi:MAG: hypothetical protein M3Y79_04500 [Pseudomonadota bacterium]|nr:hypothetical protein [Pseudomonadota bacterium]